VDETVRLESEGGERGAFCCLELGPHGTDTAVMVMGVLVGVGVVSMPCFCREEVTTCLMTLELAHSGPDGEMTGVLLFSASCFCADGVTSCLVSSLR